MASPVTIENDALVMEVWPALGGKVSSLIDKADRFELLFNYPAELPTGPLYDVSYAKSWYAGWDECFPAVAPSRYAGHPYDGIAVPDHGELWGLPTTAVPTKDGITVVWQGLRFGYRLTRKLYLDGPALRAEYTLVNLAPFEFRFVWTPHALLSMESPVELAFYGGTARPMPFRLSHDANANQIQKPFDWPLAEADADLSRPATLPPHRGWRAFSVGPIDAAARVRYPARGRSLAVAFSAGNLEEDRAGPAAHWGLWVNTGGWAGHRHFSLGPTAGRYDQLDLAIADGSAGRVPASGRSDWSVALTVGS